MKKMKKGFTLIELLIVVVIVGILALAAIPLITANTRDARRSEGEQQLGSMKGQARVAFAKVGTAPATLTGAMTLAGKGSGVNANELIGKYFAISDTIGVVSAGVTANLTTTGTGASANVTGDGTGVLAFSWAGGDGTITWS